MPKGTQPRVGGALCRAALAFALAAAPAAASDHATETELKLAYLVNFVRFTEWPGAAEGPLTVCVIGRNPFGESLDALEGKTIRNRRISVKRKASVDSLRTCQVLFVAESERSNLASILDYVKGHAVLTVGDSQGFAERGVMINIVETGSRLGFEINADRAREGRLAISSQLLRLARNVY